MKTSANTAKNRNRSAASRSSGTRPKASPPLRFGYRFREVVMIALAMLLVYLCMALFSYSPQDPGYDMATSAAQVQNIAGRMGAWTASLCFVVLGYGAYALPILLLIKQLELFFTRHEPLQWSALLVGWRLLGAFFLLLATAVLAAIQFQSLEVNPQASAGGILGKALGEWTVDALNVQGGTLLFIAVFALGWTIYCKLSWLRLMDLIGKVTLDLVEVLQGLASRWWAARSEQRALRLKLREADAQAERVASRGPAAATPSVSRSAVQDGEGRVASQRFATRLSQVGRPLTGVTRLVSTAGRSAAGAVTGAGAALAALAFKAPRSAIQTAEPVERREPVFEDDPADWLEDEPFGPAEPARAQPPRAPVMPVAAAEPVARAAAGAAHAPAVPSTPAAPIAPVTSPAPAVSPAAHIMPTVAPPAPSPAAVAPVAPPTIPSAPAPAPAPAPAAAVATPSWPAPPQDRLVEEDMDLDELDDDLPFDLPEATPAVPGPSVSTFAAAAPMPGAVPVPPASLAAAPVARPQPQTVTAYPGVAPVVVDAGLVGTLPPLSLLDPPQIRPNSFSPEALESMSRLLEIKLKEFGVEVQVVSAHPGPVITRFEIQPAAGIKVSRITNLAKDLARSMAVISVRVVEVIPGKTTVGIEVPNENRQIVRFSEVLTTPEFEEAKSVVTIALGHDIGGHPVTADLARMPHLLVAGTTGSGKSVGVNAMLLSILYKSTPEQVRLIMIDPKMLELSIYEGIPHLLCPVVTDMKEAANALRWSVAEMDRRYKLMAAMGVRNLAGFNRKVREAEEAGMPLGDPLYRRESPDDMPPPLKALPTIVVVVDEFADMMMIVGKKVEELIARIAQKARAAGIHLILATQRPSVDVITGLIKANIPTRIAFQVSSKIDSRTILDQGGAEQLLGHGDMLYLPPGTGLPIRVHGAFVSDDEVHRTVEAWKMRGAPDYIEDILAGTEEGGGGSYDSTGGEGGEGSEEDPLYDEAVRFVTESRRASISAVQRKLKIGYNRAARMIEAMEMAGVVTSMNSNGSREVIAPAPLRD